MAPPPLNFESSYAALKEFCRDPLLDSKSCYRLKSCYRDSLLLQHNKPVICYETKNLFKIRD